MKARAITGLGIACALGTGGADEFFAAMRAPAPPDKPIASFDRTKYGDEKLPIVEVPEFDPTKYLGDKGLRVLDRLTKLLVVAARLALADAGLKKDNAWTALTPEMVGVCCSNAYGSLEAITELDRVAKLEDARYINPAKFPNTVSNSASGYVSIWEDLRALNVTVSDGNCGGLDAVACADIFLASNRATAILTGGGEAMSEALFLAFEKLGALGDGRLGEAAVFFALETAAGAKARNAKVLGEIAGYGTAFVSSAESAVIVASGEAIERAITQALADAGIEGKDVDVVASSVAGLDPFDREELAAIAKIVGPSVPVAAPKRVLGETLGAGGALGIASGLAWLAGAPFPSPARSARPPLLVHGAAPKKVDTVLVTAVGYYGNASAVVVRRPL